MKVASDKPIGNRLNIKSILEVIGLDLILQTINQFSQSLEYSNQNKDELLEKKLEVLRPAVKKEIYAMLSFLETSNNEEKHRLEGEILRLSENFQELPSKVANTLVSDSLKIAVERTAFYYNSVPPKYIYLLKEYGNLDFKEDLLKMYNLRFGASVKSWDDVNGKDFDEFAAFTLSGGNSKYFNKSNILENVLESRKRSTAFQYPHSFNKFHEDYLGKYITDNSSIEEINFKSVALPKTYPVTIPKAIKFDLETGLWPLLVFINFDRSDFINEMYGITPLVRVFSSTEEYRRQYPDSPENSHVVVIANPKSSEELTSILSMDQVHKVIINSDESQREKLKRWTTESAGRTVFLRQLPLVTISCLLNLSKLLESAARVHQENHQKDFALSRYQMALDLQLKAGEVLENFRRNKRENQ